MRDLNKNSQRNCPNTLDYCFLCEKRPDISIDALELSPDMIKTAQKTVRALNLESQIHYFQGNVENMDKIFSDSYDLVYSNDSLHHWENLEKAFSEINRVVRPQGSVYIHDSKRNLNFGGKIILNLLGRFFAGKMWKYWKSSVNASYTVQELQEIINKELNYSWVGSEDLMDLLILSKTKKSHRIFCKIKSHFFKS